MTNEQKIEFTDSLLRLLENYNTSEDMPVLVGHLNSPQGISGFEPAPNGTPVFEYKDRYVIYLKNSITTVSVPYYKHSLKPSIDFI